MRFASGAIDTLSGDMAQSAPDRGRASCSVRAANVEAIWRVLRGIVFQGDSWLLQVDLADGQAITARAQKHFSAEVGALEVGQTVDLHVRRDRVHLL